MAFNTLTPEEQHVIQDKGTERPFTGQFNEHFENGLYLCKQCDAPLYRSEHKFPSHCGWPSFDDEIEGAVARHVDADGRRTEIVCAHCGGHLGHVFEGEMQTAKNIRHCVNSISMNFVSAEELAREGGCELKKAYFAGGCFWGVEHLLQQAPGVESVVSGYMGGPSENPTYTQVCSKTSGHLEVVEVSYDAAQVSYETLAKLFFEIHDPTQRGGQGPDLGPQYASAIFVADDEERATVDRLIDVLRGKGMDVVTSVLPMAPFWRAEEYHQDYYAKTGKAPYCHRYEKKF
ncbi:bifunctional methionine sulfoxide reductase B/A protein [Marinobacterium rhizophilum]|uniref:Peptide methionine sulfoxide reductase MsrA n=1 Tax=Marinobacterium rhizophilum TaxID=420402 RepID=A0ABY5HI62_9GAMM|nr:bifunctional methionine sulfoxide reductase B/A protein [Marinobacterium rhizophilum]UTW11654.1 bifunctional methionine sulfoxide reductase B/A protein [Marinobacterium rhizophilum]